MANPDSPGKWLFNRERVISVDILFLYTLHSLSASFCFSFCLNFNRIVSLIPVQYLYLIAGHAVLCVVEQHWGVFLEKKQMTSALSWHDMTLSTSGNGLKCTFNQSVVTDHRNFPSVLWHCWLGDRNGIHPGKENWVSVCWWWHFDWSFVRLCHHSPPPSFLAPIKSRMETFWYRLTQIHLENGS